MQQSFGISYADFLSASPIGTTQQYSVFLVLLSLAVILSLGHHHQNNYCTHMKHNNAVLVSCTSCSVQASSLGGNQRSIIRHMKLYCLHTVHVTSNLHKSDNFQAILSWIPVKCRAVSCRTSVLCPRNVRALSTKRLCSVCYLHRGRQCQHVNTTWFARVTRRPGRFAK